MPIVDKPDIISNFANFGSMNFIDCSCKNSERPEKNGILKIGRSKSMKFIDRKKHLLIILTFAVVNDDMVGVEHIFVV